MHDGNKVVESGGDEMNFTGEYMHSVDEKGRFIMPSRFRDDLKVNSYVITKGIENCLYAQSIDSFEEKVEKLNRLSNNKKEVRNIKRHIIGSAVTCEIDRQGRTVIPPILREYGNISGDIYIVGVGDKIEIWDVNSWKEYKADENITQQSISDSIENMEGFEL